MHADVRGTHPGLPLGTLSGGECALIFMRLAELAANQLATRYPTLLVLDASSFLLGNDWLKTYGEHLSSAEIRFQTIASIPRRYLDLNELQWAGWKVYQLEGAQCNGDILDSRLTSNGAHVSSALVAGNLDLGTWRGAKREASISDRVYLTASICRGARKFCAQNGVDMR